MQLLTNEVEKQSFSGEGKKYIFDYIYNIVRQKQEQTKKQEQDQLQRQYTQSALISNNFQNYKVTNGYNFSGYNITKYLGLVSGEVVEGTGLVSDLRADFSDLFGTTSKTYSKKIKNVKKAALSDMISEAISLGANAIIGVSYNNMIFSRDMIGVSVNGTAVYIEPEEKWSEEQKKYVW